jgi:hypothetical protein
VSSYETAAGHKATVFDHMLTGMRVARHIPKAGFSEVH